MSGHETGQGDEPAIPGLTFRPASRADWPAIADLMNRGRAADGLTEVQTAEVLEAELPETDQFQLARDCHIAEVDGLPVGLAMGRVRVREDILVGDTWCAVDPAWRRRGIGTALFHRALDAMRPVLAAELRPFPRELRTFAMDVEVGTRALLEAEGYVPVRYGFEMRRPITGTLPEHPLPAGLEIRPVLERDHRTIYDANDEAFLDHWGHAVHTDDDFRALFSSPAVDTSLWQVAWDGGQVAGVVINTILEAENLQFGIRRGWLDQVSVRRQWRGRGLAKALCTASFRKLREQGMEEAWLGVDGANPNGALQLYEGLGFTVARRWQAYGRPVDGPAPAGWRSGGDRATIDA